MLICPSQFGCDGGRVVEIDSFARIRPLLEEVKLCGCFRREHGAPGERIGVEFVGPANVPVFGHPYFECEADLVFREQGEQFIFWLWFNEL